MPFRLRSGIVVPPRQRPVKTRRASRLVVRAGDSVLLQRDTDPGVPGSEWWMTPGGGLQAGEDWATAALRELLEETGRWLDPAQLIGPIAHRVVTHGFSDQITIQEEHFFLVETERFEPDTAGYTEGERITIGGTAWLTPEQFAGRRVYPAELPVLMTLGPEDFIDLGRVDESIIPIDPLDLARYGLPH